MTRKIVTIGAKPRSLAGGADASAERWIRGASATAGKSTKRLTFDLDEDLHRRLRIMAATEGRTMADVVRELLDEACDG